LGCFAPVSLPHAYPHHHRHPFAFSWPPLNRRDGSDSAGAAPSRTPDPDAVPSGYPGVGLHTSGGSGQGHPSHSRPHKSLMAGHPRASRVEEEGAEAEGQPQAVAGGAGAAVGMREQVALRCGACVHCCVYVRLSPQPRVVCGLGSHLHTACALPARSRHSFACTSHAS
jgi:hypothetical protein